MISFAISKEDKSMNKKTIIPFKPSKQYSLLQIFFLCLIVVGIGSFSMPYSIQAQDSTNQVIETPDSVNTGNATNADPMGGAGGFDDLIYEDKKFTDYNNIRLTGNIPRDFTASTTSKYEKSVKNISKDEKRSVRQAQDRFYEESNYAIDELLLSGKVYYDDTITRYLNRIVDELLPFEEGSKDSISEYNEDLRKDIRVYSVKSPAMNAFTTESGIIMVNWGLISKLDNEAQLASVLSHEITHFRDDHVLDNFIEKTKIKQGVGVYKRSNYLDRVTAQSSYSKELELKADTGGLTIYLPTDYAPSATLSLFDKLAYSHVPYTDAPFDLSVFDIDTLFDMPDKILAGVSYLPIKPEDGDDSETHPGLSDRKTKIQNIVAGMSDDGKKEFLVSERKFKEVQKAIRYELCKEALYKKDYPMAIYRSTVLLKDDPYNKYLRKNIIKGVYGIAKFKNYDKYEDLSDDYDMDEIEGQSLAAYLLFEELGGEETTALAMALAYHYQQNFDYNDIEVNKMLEDLTKEMVVVYDFTVNSFENVRNETKAGFEDMNLAQFNLSFLTKDSRCKYDCPAIIERAIKEKKDLQERREAISDVEYKSLRKKLRSRHYSLGVDRLVLVDPFYLKIDYRKKNAVNYLDSEPAQLDLAKKIETNAKKLDMRVKTLNSRTINKRSSEKFDEIAFLNEWIAERLGYGRMDFVAIDYERAKTLSKKYKTPNFLWSGAVNTKETNIKGMIYGCYAIVFPPLIPRIVGPNNYTYYYSLLFDLEKEEALIYDYNLVKMSDTRATLNSNIYHHLWQMNRD